MNLNSIFDTLVYGKGTAKRKDYNFTLSAKRIGEREIKGLVKEELERNYYVTYKGITVLIIQEKGVKFDFETAVIYRMSESVIKNRNKFNPIINKTLDRITSYMIEPHNVYKEKYER